MQVCLDARVVCGEKQSIVGYFQEIESFAACASLADRVTFLGSFRRNCAVLLRNVSGGSNSEGSKPRASP